MFLCVALTANGQTYIGPIIGWEHMYYDLGVKYHHKNPVTREAHPDAESLSDDVVFGIRVGQQIGEKLSLVYTVSISEKELIGWGNGLLGDIKERSIFFATQHDLQFASMVYKGLGAGVGAGYWSSGTIRIPNDYFVTARNKQEYSGLASISYRQGNLIAELRYRQGLLLKEQPSDGLIFMQPTHSFALHVGYMFELLPLSSRRKRGKKANCPKF